jgi:hypothetical protein
MCDGPDSPVAQREILGGDDVHGFWVSTGLDAVIGKARGVLCVS